MFFVLLICLHISVLLCLFICHGHLLMNYSRCRCLSMAMLITMIIIIIIIVLVITIISACTTFLSEWPMMFTALRPGRTKSFRRSSRSSFSRPRRSCTPKPTPRSVLSNLQPSATYIFNKGKKGRYCSIHFRRTEMLQIRIYLLFVFILVPPSSLYSYITDYDFTMKL